MLAFDVLNIPRIIFYVKHIFYVDILPSFHFPLSITPPPTVAAGVSDSRSLNSLEINGLMDFGATYLGKTAARATHSNARKPIFSGY